jgi:hypothetical protein
MKVRSLKAKRIAQILTVILCTIMFYFLMLDIWIKFNHRTTTSGLRLKDDGEPTKFLPCLTACRRMGYRKRGVRTSEEDFINQTFEMVRKLTYYLYLKNTIKLQLSD